MSLASGDHETFWPESIRPQRRPTSRLRDSRSETVTDLFPDTGSEEARLAAAALADLLQLPEGWDGTDARRVSYDVFQFALEMLNQLDSAPSGARAQFVPLTHGGVQVEWHSLSGDLEIEIRRPFRFEYFFEDARSGQTEEAVGTNDFRRVEQLLQRL